MAAWCALLIGVKRARSSGKLFWVATVLAAAGVLLPWLKGPERLPRAYAEAAEELKVATRTVLGPGDFLWVDATEVGASMRDPLAGANVWKLFGELRSKDGEGGGRGDRHGAELLARPEYFAAGAYVLALSPLVVLLLSFLGARGLRGSPWVWVSGLLLVGIYCLGRWRVAATEGARAAAGIEIGLGAWLTMLAAMVAGLAFLLRWWFPKAKWI